MNFNNKFYYYKLLRIKKLQSDFNLYKQITKMILASNFIKLHINVSLI